MMDSTSFWDSLKKVGSEISGAADKVADYAGKVKGFVDSGTAGAGGTHTVVYTPETQGNMNMVLIAAGVLVLILLLRKG